MRKRRSASTTTAISAGTFWGNADQMAYARILGSSIGGLVGARGADQRFLRAFETMCLECCVRDVATLRLNPRDGNCCLARSLCCGKVVRMAFLSGHIARISNLACGFAGRVPAFVVAGITGDVACAIMSQHVAQKSTTASDCAVMSQHWAQESAQGRFGVKGLLYRFQ